MGHFMMMLNCLSSSHLALRKGSLTVIGSPVPQRESESGEKRKGDEMEFPHAFPTYCLVYIKPCAEGSRNRSNKEQEYRC